MSEMTYEEANYWDELFTKNPPKQKRPKTWVKKIGLFFD